MRKFGNCVCADLDPFVAGHCGAVKVRKFDLVTSPWSKVGCSIDHRLNNLPTRTTILFRSGTQVVFVGLRFGPQQTQFLSIVLIRSSNRDAARNVSAQFLNCQRCVCDRHFSDCWILCLSGSVDVNCCDKGRKLMARVRKVTFPTEKSFFL